MIIYKLWPLKVILLWPIVISQPVSEAFTLDATSLCLQKLEHVTLEFIQPDTLNGVDPDDVGHPLGVPLPEGYPLPFPTTPLAKAPEISPIFFKTKYFQGDIIMRSKEEYCKVFLVPSLESDESLFDERSHSPSRNRRMASREDTKWPWDDEQLTKWPKATIPYKISSKFSAEERKQMHKAMGEFHDKTCIKFPHYSGQREYIHIVKGGPVAVCASYIGHVPGSGQKLILGDGCIGTGTKFGTVIHEMMHAAGFYHTQSRSDRDDAVKIHWQNIIKDYRTQFNKTRTVMHHFKIPYDINSVMHYAWNAFAKNHTTGLRTISEKYKKDRTFEQQHILSERDVRGLNKLYDCRNKDENYGNPTTYVARCDGGCGNGNCIAPGRCECRDGYEGSKCDQPRCDGGCGNGNCIGPGRCQCRDGYEGSKCDQPRCDGGCRNGNCIGPGRCECRNGYEGSKCDQLTRPTTVSTTSQSTTTTRVFPNRPSDILTRRPTTLPTTTQSTTTISYNERDLWYAAKRGDLNFVNRAISAGTYLNWRNPSENQTTALHAAAELNKVNVVGALLRGGADKDIRDIRGMTPLYIASWLGTREAANTLLDYSANVNIAGNNGSTPLMVATWKGHQDIVMALLDANADTNASNRNDETVLHSAAAYNKPNIARLLLQKGINTSKRDKWGLTAEELAIEQGNHGVARIIRNGVAGLNRDSMPNRRDQFWHAVPQNG